MSLGFPLYIHLGFQSLRPCIEHILRARVCHSTPPRRGTMTVNPLVGTDALFHVPLASAIAVTT